MQLVAEGRAVAVDDGIRPRLHPDSVDDQRIALVMADGIALPRWLESLRVRHMQAHMAHDFAIHIDERDLILLLQEQKLELDGEREGRRLRTALIVRVRDRLAG